MGHKGLESWHVLPYSGESADLQLAAGDGMLATVGSEASSTPLLRWYSMQPAALILGIGQQLAEFDLDACRAAGLRLHRRASGGTAVLVEPDQLMLDIVLPPTHRLARPDVTESYRWLGEVWVLALARLGLAAHLITTSEARADTQMLAALMRRACYGGRSPYEVLVEGRKVVGLAQVRRRTGSLLQVGIYTHWSAQRLVNLLAISQSERAALIAALTERVAGLLDVLPTRLEMHAPAPSQASAQSPLFPLVMQAFADALQELQHAVLVDMPWSSAAAEARAQAAARYAPLA